MATSARCHYRSASSTSLREHLAAKGLGADFGAMPEDAPLFCGLKNVMAPMDGQRVYDLMKAAFGKGADSVQGRDADAATRIRKTSPHGLRHTHARKWVEASADRGILRDRFGHVSSYPSVLDEPTAAVAGFQNFATPFRDTWSQAINVFTNSKMMSAVIAQRMSGADGAVASNDSGIDGDSTPEPAVENRHRRAAI